jgi:enoyl-CoA hydratase/carnithine racemase
MDTIQLETRGPVTWVWLNRPRQLNAMDRTMLDELREAFDGIRQDDSVRAVVLAGRGAAFSAGFDVAWMAGQDTESIVGGLAGVEAVYDTIESCPKPVIAAAHGAVMGGGLLLALVADLRLAADEASLGAPEVKIGIWPNLRLIPRLERLVGLGAAKRIVLTGEPVDAAAALRIGLVEWVAAGEDLYGEAQALAARLASLPAGAVQASKAAFAAAHQPGYVEWERAEFAACWARPERGAAMRAFLEGRR